MTLGLHVSTPKLMSPPTSLKNIPFSLGLRSVRICVKQENREKQFLKLKELLKSRDYSNGVIEAALDRAREIPHSTALKRILRKP